MPERIGQEIIQELDVHNEIDMQVLEEQDNDEEDEDIVEEEPAAEEDYDPRIFEELKERA